MILNDSYNHKKVNEELEKAVGRPFGLKYILKHGRIGSPRLEIVSYSQSFNSYFTYDNSRNFGNIELRPEGIIFRFRSILDLYAWVIPYYHLTIFSSGETITYYHGPEKIEVRPTGKQIHLSKFNRTIVDMKARYMNTPG